TPEPGAAHRATERIPTRPKRPREDLRPWTRRFASSGGRTVLRAPGVLLQEILNQGEVGGQLLLPPADAHDESQKAHPDHGVSQKEVKHGLHPHKHAFRPRSIPSTGATVPSSAAPARPTVPTPRDEPG